MGGGYLRPDRWCRHLLDHPAITLLDDSVTSLQEGSPASVTLDKGTRLHANAVVVCAAGASQQLPGLGWLPLKHIRGQVSYCQATEASRQWQQAQCHGGYLTPALDDLHCVGATFNLHDSQPAPTDADDADNLAQLKHYLPEHWQALGGEAIIIQDRRVAFRCQSLDFVPLCGPLPGHRQPASRGHRPVPEPGPRQPGHYWQASHVGVSHIRNGCPAGEQRREKSHIRRISQASRRVIKTGSSISSPVSGSMALMTKPRNGCGGMSS